MMTPVIEHREAWSLLPWYVNGTLEGGDLDAVVAHLHACDECCDEVARCRALATAVRTLPAPAPLADGLARVLRRIDAMEAERASPPRWRRWLGERWADLGDLFGATPAPLRWAVGVQAAMVVVLAALLVGQALPGGSAYRTLAAPGDPAPGRPQVRLVLAEDAQERDIRALLASVGGSLTSGPSAVGAYAVALPARSPAAVPSALATLRASPIVRLAEPIVSQ